MATLTANVPRSLSDALAAHCAATGESLRHVVTHALSEALGLDHGTLFQVSTTGALVQGVYKGAVTIATLKAHGDFGLGTFEGLDGEMVVLDGHFYRAHSDGRLTTPPDKALVPFAAVTNFRPQRHAALSKIESFAALTAQLDKLRRSDNLFCAVRVDGRFAGVHSRIACKVHEGVSLTEAAARQAEFHLGEVNGTVVGFWSPAFTRSISVAGWHLHFLSADRKQGGHLLDCRADSLDVKLQDIDDLHLAIPETKAFLNADLTQDSGAAVAQAEFKR
jgi:acetolactate decarboxylase